MEQSPPAYPVVNVVSLLNVTVWSALSMLDIIGTAGSDTNIIAGIRMMILELYKGLDCFEGKALARVKATV